MTDTNQNFSLRAGEALIVEVNIDQNLTGFEVKWATSFLSPNGCFSTTAILEKCSGNATLTIVDVANGLIEIPLSSSDTSPLTPGNYEHEVSIVDGSGNETVTTVGTMVITRKIINTC